MTTTRGALQYRRLRAPREHGATLVDPPSEEIPRLVTENAAKSSGYRYDCQGRSLEFLRQQARRELVDAASRYTLAYRDVAGFHEWTPSMPILLTGHQPELYHPGVWYKNFALSAFAQRIGARAIHLTIDNDTLRTPAIRVLQGTVDEPQSGFVPFDDSCEDIPFEDRPIRDAATFRSFADRVRLALAPFVARPLIESHWSFAIQAARRTENLGQVLSQARHQLEAQWGLSTLEVPFSRICRQEPFRWFFAHLLAQLPRFHDVYNSSLIEYRRVHRLRSNTHPVPQLVGVDDWLETPFWIWREDLPRRRRLFVRPAGGEVELSDLNRSYGGLRLHADGDAEVAVRQLGELAQQGIRIRPRALLTTMYARLFLCDLFFHGIGGAKYDQLTDIIMERFFGLSPPAFLTLTATALLPIRHTTVSQDDLRRVNHLLRELRFNPQRHVEENEQTRPLIVAKQRCIESGGDPADRRSLHQEIERVNGALQPYVELYRKELVDEREDCLSLLRREKILASREYSFCLFPEDTLRPLLLDF